MKSLRESLFDVARKNKNMSGDELFGKFYPVFLEKQEKIHGIDYVNNFLFGDGENILRRQCYKYIDEFLEYRFYFKSR